MANFRKKCNESIEIGIRNIVDKMKKNRIMGQHEKDSSFTIIFIGA